MFTDQQQPASDSDMSWKRYIQIALAIGLVLALVRVGLIYRERHEDVQTKKQPDVITHEMQEDDYVVLPKSYAFDVPSARKELNGKTVWVRAGNQMQMYPYDPAAKRVNFAKELGVLPPLEKLTVKDFALQKPPKGDHQVLAIVEREGKPLVAVAVGAANARGDAYYINESFFMKDPHELYKHWPSATWSAIDRHEVQPGMSELQAVFALGGGIPQGSGSPGNRTIEFNNAGHPVSVTFVDNKATKITTP